MRVLVLAAVSCLAGVASAEPPLPPPPDVIPAEGAVVSRNTKIWVFERGTFVQLYDSRDTEVMLTLSTITISPFGALEKLTPMTELSPGRYELRSYRGVFSTFQVGDDVDTTPPLQPEVEVTTAGKVGDLASSVTVTTAAASDSFLVVMGEPQVWEPPSLFAASAKGSATAYDFYAGELRLKVARVDAAGNASEALEVVTTVPKERACSVAPVLPLSLLALALLRRKLSPSAA